MIWMVLTFVNMNTMKTEYEINMPSSYTSVAECEADIKEVAKENVFKGTVNSRVQPLIVQFSCAQGIDPR